MTRRVLTLNIYLALAPEPPGAGSWDKHLGSNTGPCGPLSSSLCCSQLLAIQTSAISTYIPFVRAMFFPALCSRELGYDLLRCLSNLTCRGKNISQEACGTSEKITHKLRIHCIVLPLLIVYVYFALNTK